MYLNRKTLRLSSLKSKVSNSQVETPSLHNLRASENKTKPLAEAVSFPVLNYFIAAACLGFFIYLLYSVNGGKQAIPGFDSNQWWQYMVSSVPLILSILLVLFSSQESVRVYKDRIEFCRHIIIGFYKKESKQKELSELINISIIKRGYERITMTTSSYFLVFNFRPYQEIEALQCNSEITAVGYLQQLKIAIPKLRETQRSVTIKNIVES